jgi:hypothetical protein
VCSGRLERANSTDDEADSHGRPSSAQLASLLSASASSTRLGAGKRWTGNGSLAVGAAVSAAAGSRVGEAFTVREGSRVGEAFTDREGNRVGTAFAAGVGKRADCTDGRRWGPGCSLTSCRCAGSSIGWATNPDVGIPSQTTTPSQAIASGNGRCQRAAGIRSSSRQFGVFVTVAFYFTRNV